MARLVEAPKSPLEDGGCLPSMALLGIQQYGIVSDERWPLDEDHINEAPPLDVFEHAIGATVGDAYNIPQGDSESIKQALSAGYVPVFAMQVDDNYEHLLPDEIYTGSTGPLLGGHMQALVGYGDGYFLVAGSWGYGFARNGFTRIATSFFDEGNATDIIVPTVVPKAVT
jgi:hypothetical protein